MTLRNVGVGQTVTVSKITGVGAIKRRIMDMGLTKGTSVYVRKVAPLGDPIEVTVRGYELSLRKADAELIAIFLPPDFQRLEQLKQTIRFDKTNLMSLKRFNIY